jgi:hypothetical protein
MCQERLYHPGLSELRYQSLLADAADHLRLVAEHRLAGQDSGSGRRSDAGSLRLF